MYPFGSSKNGRHALLVVSLILRVYSLMDTIKWLNEAIEAEFGEAIVARDESLAALLDVRGLGPPDLVWLQKNAKNSSLIGMQG